MKTLVLMFAAAACALAQTDAPGVTVELGGASLLHRATVSYPRGALTKNITGSVVVDATLDSTGEVVDARVVSGPEELRSAVLQSVLQWHFAPGAGHRQ